MQMICGKGLLGLVFALLVLALAAPAAPDQAPAGRPGAPPEVAGPLGVPLGKILTLKGKLLTPAEITWKSGQGEKLLRVSEVEGKPLEPPVVLPLQGIPGFSLAGLEAGKELELKGYQTGGFAGIPPGFDPADGIWQDEAWHFQFVLVVIRRIGG